MPSRSKSLAEFRQPSASLYQMRLEAMDIGRRGRAAAVFAYLFDVSLRNPSGAAAAGAHLAEGGFRA